MQLQCMISRFCSVYPQCVFSCLVLADYEEVRDRKAEEDVCSDKGTCQLNLGLFVIRIESNI